MERVERMRLDYILYGLAVVFFMMTAVSLALIGEQNQRNVWVVATVVLGLFSAGLGYSQRPKAVAAKTQAVPAVPLSTMPKPEHAVVDDAHEKEGFVAENVNRTVETPMLPQAPSPMPMPVVAPMPVLPPVPTEIPAAPTKDLTSVKGIGGKRAAQLKALGISNIDVLAAASPRDLAAKMKVSPKIVEKWVAGAKELVEK